MSLRRKSRLKHLFPDNSVFDKCLAHKERFRILSYDFTVQSNSLGLLREFKKIYSYLSFQSSKRPKKIYTVFMDKGDNGQRSSHTIFSQKEVAFKTMKESEIIPLLEWLVINDAGISLDNFLQIHAGAVEKNKKGFLFPSAPGKGKTTLSLGLIMDGFKYLTDEVTLINPDNLTIEPFPRSLCIKESSFDLLQNLKSDLNLREYSLRYDNQKAWYINPTYLNKDCLGGQTRADYIVFLNFHPKEKSRIEEIQRTKALAEMAKQSFNLSSFNNKGMDALVSIVCNASCFALFSNSLKNSVKLIKSLLNHE